MKIAIYDRQLSFSDRWFERCRELGIDTLSVNMFDDDLFSLLNGHGADALLMHPPMADRRTSLVARAIIAACEASGLPVFPGARDFWHFDDKIGQKYLFEAAGVRTPKTHVLLDLQCALDWIESAEFPVVFKLRSGAGSVNVELIRSKRAAVAKARRMFGRGYPATDAAFRDVATKIRLHRAHRDWMATLRRAPSTLHTWYSARKTIDFERGYLYLQEFIPGNTHDTRVTVIGNRAFAFRRKVRPDDFRASGSGAIDYAKSGINLECIRFAFEVARRLQTNCMAFDFVEKEGRPLLVEMCFAFKPEAVYACSGHWDSNLSWVEGQVWPQDAILEDLLGRRSSD